MARATRLTKKRKLSDSIAEPSSEDNFGHRSNTPNVQESSAQELQPSQEWTISGIKDESATEYLIDWGTDPATGKPYPQSWEPKSYVNEVAVEKWKRTQRKREKRLKRARAASGSLVNSSRTSDATGNIRSGETNSGPSGIECVLPCYNIIPVSAN